MTIEKKTLKPRPDIIAFSMGLTIIPFESVIAVSECYTRTDCVEVLIATEKVILLPEDESRLFIEEYNKYLTIQEMCL